MNAAANWAAGCSSQSELEVATIARGSDDAARCSGGETGGVGVVKIERQSSRAAAGDAALFAVARSSAFLSVATIGLQFKERKS